MASAIEHLRDRWAKKFSLHVLTGAVSVAVHYGFMALLIRTGAPPLAASASGFVLGATVRFLTGFFAVFDPEQDWRASLPKYIFSLGVQAAANILLVSTFMVIGASVWTAQVLSTGLMTVLNFVLYRIWVFR